ncbi:hypothetical protein Tco_0490031 [Tanacetum coccineum]
MKIILRAALKTKAAMRDFKGCVQAIEVVDVNSTGLHYTWNQKPKGSNGTLKKIDKIMGNLQFNDDFPGISLLFFNLYKEGFREIVESRWNVNIKGYAMFRVVKRLKGLKSPLRKLLHDYGNLHERVNKIRSLMLDEAQKHDRNHLFLLDRYPSSSILREEHAHYLLAFKEAQMDKERFLKQKAKVEWVQAGDSNTTYFHKIVKSKCTRNRIEMVSDSSNIFYDGNQVPGAFIQHYNQFLRAEGVSNPLDDQDLFIRVLDNSKADCMVRDVTNDEIKSAMFSMGDDKAPGPDGFPATFFKKAWDVVGGDILLVLLGIFFSNGASYSISVNGNLHGYFKGKRGLRQGDPLSPYLFTLVMEILTLLLQRRVRNSEEFQYHHLCNKQRIINLCFADDLFLFAHGHPSSVSVIIYALEEFKQVSGLVPSIPKSTAYFCNVPNAIKASILNSMPFAEGVLPVRYLGVPLISSRLLYRDCKILVEKLESRINDWRNKFLSLAGQQLMRGFLWCQREMKKGKAKVAWDSVCIPKQEGGLGIRRIEGFNIALMATHIWSISTHKESLWVKWVHMYKLKGRSFWDVPYVCPIKDLLSNRDITRLGFSLDDSVSNLISDGVWRWPIDWLSRILVLAHLHVPLLLDDLDDVILWRDSDGVLRPFSVACVWDTIRTRADLQKLKTQDRLRQWDVGPSIDLNLLKCPLCDLVPDSHDHLFFECSFSSQVLSKVRVLCGMDDISPRLMDVVVCIVPISKGKTVVSILSRIIIAATSYYIWLERNGRLFKKNTSSPDQIVDVIMSTVRLKLVTFKFKKMSTKSRLLLDQWKIPSYCIVHDGSTRISLDHSFIYAHNQYMQRRAIWNNLDTHKAYIRDRPWCILGDFNVSLHAHDKSTGTSYIDRGMKDFQECVDSIGVYDVNCTGLRYTWNQKPMGGDGILKKIDRIMANSEFYRVFVGSNAYFQPYRISDHTPAVLRIPMTAAKRPRPFKFYNILVQHDRFAEIVLNGWTENVSGFWMFKIVKRLKALKNPLRKLLYDQGNIHDNVVKLRHDLDVAQTALDSDPNNIVLREEEASYLHAYTDALLLEEKFLSQKAKIEWLKLGDENTAYFHQVVKGQAFRNIIDCITNSNGLSIDGEQVPMAFVDHYTEFLGQQGITTTFDTENLFCNTLSEDIANHMVREVTDQEIHKAMFSIGDNKALGLDGYPAAFFKEAWNIVGTDVTKAIKEFFTNGVLLKELNHTIIALIPKVNNPMRINDYRPISCCNVLFKCISSIISNRMKGALNELVNINQSAFVPGRRISDNILLTQELMHNYHLDRGVPRCAFKVDIQKAYDTVDWNFLRAVLIGFGFHHRMIGWIMECVTSTSFSISINGCLHGYFKGKCGLRQGDPLSPYLFTLVMEVLTLMLHRRARVTNSFTYHRYCSKLNIINLCFADDLFLFAHGDVDSARVIMDSLDEFKNASGLTPSLPKSTAYFCNVLNYVKIGILVVLPFEEEKLPVKYLGVPLVPSRFVYRDSAELVERVKRRNSEMKKGKAKVAWEVVCLPKKEGGLGSSFGNGNRTFAWHDHWSSLGPLSSVVSNRDIYSAGFHLNAKVSEITMLNAWKWPDSWYVKYPLLSTVPAPNFSDALDRVYLTNWSNVDVEFSVAEVWEALRPRNSEVKWYHVVWFSHQIPRYAIHLWLVVKRKLKTQDLLRSWDVSSNQNLASLVCPLCESQPDSHDHLFFGCRVSSWIWDQLKPYMCIPNLPSALNDIVEFLIPFANEVDSFCCCLLLYMARA